MNWKSMTAREVWDALKSAPKVAGVWTAAGIGYPTTTSARHDVRGHIVALDYGPRGVTVSTRLGALPNRAAADAVLREAGWWLVDE